MSRRCPYCGERVPKNSITCPKCYKRMPSTQEGASGSDMNPIRNGKSRMLALVLDLIPGLIGLLGIGQIYLGDKRFLPVLAFGFVVFAAAVFLTILLVTLLLAVPLWIIYAIMYVVVLLNAVIRPIGSGTD